MKIKGFTITEVVIVTGIIGLIAILTMPTLISNQKKLIYSKGLQVAVVNFESAMSNIMARDGADDLLDTLAWKNVTNTLNTSSNNEVNGFVYDIGRAMTITTYSLGVPRTYQGLNGTSVTIGSPVRIVVSNGVEYYIEIANVSDDNKKNELEALQNNSNYTNQAATVYIDTNGSASPNVYGRDLFSFDLGVDGRLYPFGGHDYNFYHGVSSTNLEEGCKNGNGAFCAAYLMNNNYEMDY